MKKSFNEIIKPVLVLVCICLVVTALLAYINSVTSPIIAKAEQEKTEDKRWLLQKAVERYPNATQREIAAYLNWGASTVNKYIKLL